MYKRFHINLKTHINTLISYMSTVTISKNSPRRIKCEWCRYLLVKEVLQWVSSSTRYHVILILIINIKFAYRHNCVQIINCHNTRKKISFKYYLFIINYYKDKQQLLKKYRQFYDHFIS